MAARRHLWSRRALVVRAMPVAGTRRGRLPWPVEPNLGGWGGGEQGVTGHPGRG